MAQKTVEEEKQLGLLTSLAKKLVKTLENKPEPEFAISKAGVTDFITGALDPAYVLGDGDLMQIAVRACRHHPKGDESKRCSSTH